MPISWPRSKARGGMFEQLCEDLPWSQRLSEVWRMRDPAERDASLALRSARGHRLRQAVGWYRNHKPHKMGCLNLRPSTSSQTGKTGSVLNRR